MSSIIDSMSSVIDIIISTRFLISLIFVMGLISNYNLTLENNRVVAQEQAAYVQVESINSVILTSPEVVGFVKRTYKDTPVIYSNTTFTNYLNNVTRSSIKVLKKNTFEERAEYLAVDPEYLVGSEISNKVAVENDSIDIINGVYPRVLSNEDVMFKTSSNSLYIPEVNSKKLGGLAVYQNANLNIAFYEKSVSTENFLKFFGTQELYTIIPYKDANGILLSYVILNVR